MTAQAANHSPLCDAHWIFFDLDGTLADSLPGLRGSIVDALAACGRSLPECDLRPFIGPGIRTILRNLDRELLSTGITDEDLDRMEKAFRASYDMGGVLNTAFFAGVATTLRELKQFGRELFVVTNKPRLATATLLERDNLQPLFTDVVSRDSRQPPFASKAEMLMDTVVRHGADVRRSIMVGDTAEDGHAAEQAGMHFVHARYGYGALPGTKTIAIETFPEILALCAAGEQAKGNA